MHGQSKKIKKIYCFKIVSLHISRQVKGHGGSGLAARGHLVRNGNLCWDNQGLLRVCLN